MGVTVQTLKDGDQKTYPKAGDTVTMDYTGTLLDGTVSVGPILVLVHFPPGVSSGSSTTYQQQYVLLMIP